MSARNKHKQTVYGLLVIILQLNTFNSYYKFIPKDYKNIFYVEKIGFNKYILNKTKYYK